MEMYADRKGWELGEVEVDVDWPDGAKRRRTAPSTSRSGIPAELTDEQRRAPAVIAGKCPVHR